MIIKFSTRQTYEKLIHKMYMRDKIFNMKTAERLINNDMGQN